MTTGAKVWFWLVLIGNGLGTVNTLRLPGIPLDDRIVSTLCGVAMVVGSILLLNRRKAGFFVMVGVQTLSGLISFAKGVNIIFLIIVAAIQLGIVYYFINKNSDVMQ